MMSTSSDTDLRAAALSPSDRGGLGCPDIRIDQYQSKVRITPVGRDPVELRLVDAERLRRHVTDFTYQAEERRPFGLPVDPLTAQTFLSSAKRIAYHCFVGCTYENNRTRQQALRVFTEAISIALLRGRPLQVEIFNQSGEYLPWEWLGVLDRQSDLEAEARSLLGFTAVVYRRDITEANPTNHSGFLTAQPLQVRFFRHPDLAGTRFELRFFKFSGLFRLLGPLPPPGGVLALPEQLADPLHSPDGPDQSLEGPDQVVHLSCHHGTDKDPRTLSPHELALLESKLSFGTDTGLEINVTELENELAETAGAPEVIERPLVFFNGCRGDFYPFATESVAGVLLRNCNRAVVSTAMKVPDDVAAEFGRFFYERLLVGQASAEAVLRARWDLLSARGSPLGLLYTYYGQPDLHVAPTSDIPSSWWSPTIARGWCA